MSPQNRPNMQIKGNTTIFDQNERRKIKNLIDKKYGKTSIVYDYRPQLTETGEEMSPISEAIYKATGKVVSGQTVERLAGLRPEQVTKGCKNENIVIVAQFLGFKGYDEFMHYFKTIKEKPEAKFNIQELIKKHLITIEFATNKSLTIRLLTENKYEVTHSRKTKFQLNDVLIIEKFEVGDSFSCEKVERKLDGKTMNLGAYVSNTGNKVVAISLGK